MDAALATGEEEMGVGVVPGDLIHFELELLVSAHLVGTHVDERHQVLLVADCNCLAIG